MVFVMSLFVVGLFCGGCAQNEKAKVTMTVTAVDDQMAMATTTVEKTEKGNDVSVLGTIFNGIGEVIAFPFKLIAELFRGIF